MKTAQLALTFCLLTIVAFGTLNAQGDPFGFAGDADLVSVSATTKDAKIQSGSTHQGFLKVDIKDGWHINSAKPYEDWLIPAELSFGTFDGITGGKISYPAGVDEFVGEDKASVYSHQISIPFQFTVTAGLSDGDYIFPLKFQFQPCNNKECRAPQTVDVDLAVVVSSAGVAGTTTSVEPIDDITTDDSNSVQQESELVEIIEKYGFWGYFIILGLAWLTGLLLSFSPCTYPMVPITVSIFAGQDRSMGKGFILSLFFVGSMALVYGIMGVVVAKVGTVFGAWLADPAVVIGIAVIFVVFALSMFGLFELNVPMWLRQKLGSSGSGGGILSVMLMGAVAALVVSPCVGPFVAGILLYVATSGSPVLGFLILFVFAFGLGTLYMLIGTFSSAMNKLPGAGMWMDTVKKFFGFVLLIMAIYFLRTVIDDSVTAIVTALLLLSFAVFGGGLDKLTAESNTFSRLKKLLGLIAFILGLYLMLGFLLNEGFVYPPASKWLPSVGENSEEKGELIPWVHDLDEGLAMAARENKPVLIDTWATWCANCRVLDSKTFSRPEVAREAERFIPIKIQLEKAGSPEVKAFMQRFGLKSYSLPTTLLLDSSGRVKKIMQGVVGPEDMIAEMQKLK